MMIHCSNCQDRDISITFGWIAIKFYTDIHGPQGMNPNESGDRLTFPSVSPADFGDALNFRPLPLEG